MPANRSRTMQFERTIEGAEADADVARWRAAHPSATWQQTADHFGISKTSAHDRCRRAVAAAAAAGGREALAGELLKLDALEVASWAVLEANHVAVSDGRVVKDNGAAITDHKPVLAAVNSLLRIAERRAKLLGLDTPARTEVTVITRDATEQAIRELEAELAKDSAASAG